MYSPAYLWISNYIKCQQKMLGFVTKGRKAIASLDLQLCANCIQSQEKNEIMQGFIFGMEGTPCCFYSSQTFRQDY